LPDGDATEQLLGLRWEDVDLNRSLLAVRQVLVTVGGPTSRMRRKSQHGYRRLRIAPRVTRALRKVRAEQEELARPWDGCPVRAGVLP
jgi:integrase